MIESMDNQEYKDRIAKGMEGIEDETIPSGGLAEAAQKAGAEVTVANTDYQLETVDTEVQPTVRLSPGPMDDIALMAMKDEGVRMLANAEAAVVTDLASSKAASADLSIIRGVKKRMTDKTKEYFTPVRQLMANLKEAFDMIMANVNEADTILTDKVKVYLIEEGRKEEEARRIVAEQAALAERAGKLIDSGGEVELEAAEVTVTEAPVRVRTDLGMVSKKANWKAEVIDFAALSDDYKLPDMVTLNALAKKHHDDREILGVRFYNDVTVQVRRG